MKICTITCHDVYNHGASLQAYGLMKHLMKCGYEVEIIDYKPDYLSNHYNLLDINNPKWEKSVVTKLIYLTLKIPGRVRGLNRKKSFDRFTSRYLKLTELRFTSNEELKKNLPCADAYLCGSDQIWNTLHRNGKDPAFYLDFVPYEKIKASYGASFATDTISDKYKPIVKERVERLDGVGVREQSGVEILRELNINTAVNVVDPVFLLDQEEWNYIGTREFKEKYILIYDFDNSDLIKKMAKQIGKEKGYKIYTINQSKLKYADKYYIFDGPETFVSLVRNAQYVISNSFHAAVFSIIYEKDFVIINRKEAINTRMRDLLDDLKLDHRLVNEDYKLNQLLEKVNYEESKRILNKKIELSKHYLEGVLSKKERVRNTL
ncbi:polysaccharide pyruvyl transferase family protein [Priestia aryabhattai]|uniref:polysaccharide pyruvyl transferase family protein n=1 Tax=Priestia TaxID=2800373 RepID=UPI000E128DA6|nr:MULTISPECIES: polysaccharide pyruvyl transferase family protein [Priestia]MBY0007040.1 polysaccharide pyruvyl transferase family protein [Priestia aryabhattai]MBY0048544.1 polysaccharide pyruvyl transferase family protein [Priestia aryabhattai]NLR43293.1 polysaccharide pyruvyl transferase family protein [Priestia megaterium]SUV05549.1 polysaccharide pyruvyl transferase CsaB [Priestia megaterium]